MKRRVDSLVKIALVGTIALSALLPWMSSTAFAFSGGDGSAGSPYRISSCADLANMASGLDAHYELASSINCDAQTVAPVGTDATPFTGTLDGKNFTISNITYVDTVDDVGIFGVTDGATIRNVRLDNVYYGGQSNVGLIAGRTTYTTILNIGIRNSNVESTSLHAGSLVGYLGGSTIEKSFAENTTVVGGALVGGLAGNVIGPSSVANSYFQGTVDTAADGGGVAGGVGPGPAFVQNTYANAVFAQAGSGVASYIGGGGSVSTSFIASAPYQGNNTESPLDSWDFDTIWTIRINAYPTLQASTDMSDLNGDDVLDVDQPNIGGYVSSLTGKTVAIDVGAGCELTTDDMTTEAQLAVQDPAYDYVDGLWAFEADCGEQGASTTIKLYYYDIAAEGLVARKHNPNTNAFFNIPGATFTQQTINGHAVVVVTYQIEDGGSLDTDGVVDGMINDPAGVARLVLSAPNTGLGGIE